MKTRKYKYGLSLVEMLIVIGVIALLASMVIGVVSHIDNQAKEKLTKSTLAILGAALEHFHDYEYTYQNQIYAEFDFPLDCNDYYFLNDPPGDLRITLISSLGATDVQIYSGVHDPAYSGSEMLYFFLSQVPSIRKTLDKIDSSLITNLDSNGQPVNIAITFPPSDNIKSYSLLRIIDPWGTTLRYDYYMDWVDYKAIYPGASWDDYIGFIDSNKRTFPVITSAGPDRYFGTDDDITNK